jgi:hypothetical protein
LQQNDTKQDATKHEKEQQSHHLTHHFARENSISIFTLSSTIDDPAYFRWFEAGFVRSPKRGIKEKCAGHRGDLLPHTLSYSLSFIWFCRLQSSGGPLRCGSVSRIRSVLLNHFVVVAHD